MRAKEVVMTSVVPDSSLANHRICVIGGTSGMGAAIVEAAIQRGAEVWTTGRTEESVKSTEQLFGDNCHVDVLDVRDRSEIQRYCTKFQELDAVINCAGASFPNHETEPDIFEEAIAINLTGIGHICMGMRDALATRDGSIVNFASMTSFLGSASNPAYSAAKGGIVQLTKSLARMWGSYGIRVNAIAPGYIQTKMTAFRWKNEEGNEEIVQRIPLQRWGAPHDVVGPTLFLCSKEAKYITGVVLPVDGGFLLT